jgi:hypothetical protein
LRLGLILAGLALPQSSYPLAQLGLGMIRSSLWFIRLRTSVSFAERLIPIRMNRDVRHREKIGKVGMSINASVLALFRMSEVLGTGG